MDSSHRSSRRNPSDLLGGVMFITILATAGCASPGPPRAPSLNLPEPVRDLSVTRTGNGVDLHFTAPSRSTDKLPLRGGTIIGQICRQLENQPCIPIPTSRTTVTTASPDSTHNSITWTDALPPDLTQGPPRLLSYRVEFFSPTGRSAGSSNSAITAAGPTPLRVEDLHAYGSRLGIVLTWNPSPGDVILKREDLAPDRHKSPTQHSPSSQTTPTIVWLGTHTATDTASPTNRTLDATALPGISYRYIAQRSTTVQLGSRSIELLSDLSTPITFTLREVYPPPPPTGLTAVGFYRTPPSPDVAPTFAVDLIWQPVDDAGLTAGLAGYNVYREAIDPTLDPRDKLNSAPVPTPAFHDTSADPALRYRYSVTAVDAKGNESPAATVLLEPSSKH